MLFEPSYLQLILILSIICALGLYIGQFKIKGISLGVTMVFFVGIIMGDINHRLGISVDSNMMLLAQNFGLILFVYSLGVQVGPGFFPSFKEGGMRLNAWGLLLIILTTLTSIGLYFATNLTFPNAIGLLCGAVTNTPMLGAAQQTLVELNPEQPEVANSMATACAVAYPFGVIGVLLCMVLFKKWLYRNEVPTSNTHVDDTYVAEFYVSNPAIFNQPISSVVNLVGKPIIISRVWHDGKVIIPASTTILQQGDHLMAVLQKSDQRLFMSLFGGQDAKDWNRPDIDWNNIDGSALQSKNVLVTKKEMNGVKIGSLRLRNTLNINITRINRAGIKLVAHPGLRLQLGDSITVVGEESAIAKVEEVLGNEEKSLLSPNLVAIFIGLALGIVLGCIPIAIPGMSVPIKLGVAGGPIVVGILMGAFGSRFHLATYTTRSANLMLRQMGIVVYLACLGYVAGASFFSTVFCMQGLQWILLAMVIAVVPVLICGLMAKHFSKLNYAQNAGMICAAMANPMALTYANSTDDESEASVAYAAVYPLAMFIRVITAQLIILLF